MTQENYDYNNAEETEVAQVQNLMANQNAIGAVQAALAKQRSQPSAEFCEECGEDIPLARRQAIQGVQMCISCQTLSERVKATYRQPGANSE
jgi:phage/conjugal plasmid C-4 type zinc finger TraR family protein